MFSVTWSNLSHVTKRACEDNYLFEPTPGKLRIAIVVRWPFISPLSDTSLILCQCRLSP